MLRTPMGKHYAGLIAQQEGRVYDKLVPDIKGKNFRGSDLCNTTIKFTENFLINMIKSYMTNFHLNARDLVEQVVTFEQEVMRSINDKETDYLLTAPIKIKEDYANAESSTYFYYLLWQEVFSEKYDNIYIPQKCHVVPINNNLLKQPAYLEKLKTDYPIIYKKFTEFLDKYPKKKITRIILPTHVLIPEEILPVVDLRSIVYSNASPLYLAIRSLGIGINFKNRQMIMSDMYSSIQLPM
jgi:hypothetical protein